VYTGLIKLLGIVLTTVGASPFPTWDDSCAHQSGTFLGIDSDEEAPRQGKIEDGWPMGLRLVLYLLGLFYTFYAVAIISDIFMAGIEKVTSKKVRKTDPATGRTVTSYFWNATVANLTLMALGSSAPEIMMGCFEVAFGNYLLGPLGPGVIVGSAAFNLLVISAVCVNAHDEPKVTKIKEVPVYIITATFSVFAYMWLFIIIMGPTPDVISVWEAVVTILLFPLLTVLAYFADRGKITFGLKGDEDAKDEIGLLEDATKEELAEIEFKIRQEHGDHLSEEQVISFMRAQYCTRRNKAYYHHAALQKALVHKKIDPAMVSNDADVEQGVTTATHTSDDAEEEKRTGRIVKIGFHSETYACLESAKIAKLRVVRTGPPNKVTVGYKTIAGTAGEGTDYEKTEGVLVFEKDVFEAELSIKIMNDNAYEEDEDFYIELFEPAMDPADPETNIRAELGDVPKATMTIIDDDLPGKLRFKSETVSVEEQDKDFVMNIIVERFDGSSGTISCNYETENMGAVAGVDYEEAKGAVEMGDGVTSFLIPVTIRASGRYTIKSSFNVILTDPKCTGSEAAKGKVGFAKDTDGGEDSCICHVEIKGESSETRDRLLSRMASKLHASKVAHQAWSQQVKDALFKVVDDDDEDEDGGGGPSKADYAFHILGLPWKLLFALVPPTDYCGGYPTFCCALAFIGLVTILVGDLANLVGCALALPSEITAITFVALGTSLPDTFASKAAAEMDPYADNSIGNVTGSNSVNVFLGCGLAWTLGAVYWATQKIDEPELVMRVAYAGGSAAFGGTSSRDLWLNQFSTFPNGVKDNVLAAMGCNKNEACNGSLVFMVPAGSLWFNLLVFSCNAGVALFHLWQRRRKFGGELGGPKKGFMGQYFSGAFLVSQWFIYIIASSIMCLSNQ
jgi:solute carrier family 8 (sodium/calcium exchanger)